MSPPSPIRVLHLINGLGTGGSERSLVQMLPYFAERGIVSTIVCLFRRAQGVQDEVVADDWQVHFLPEESWIRRTQAFRSLLANTEPHVIHTTLFESDVFGRLASIGMGIPVVTSLVNTSYEPVRLIDPNVKVHRLRTLQLVDAITGRLRNRAWHANSQAVAESNMHRLSIPRDRIVVIPRARPILSPDIERRAQARSAVRQELGIPLEAEVILGVGRHEYQKDHISLVRAFSQLGTGLSSTWLVIAGREGNATSQLRSETTRATGAERILLLGHRSDVSDLLQAADVFAFPSLYEGLPGSLLEAMSAGLAIVASDIPSIKEVAGDTIWYAAPGDIDTLTERLESLLTDSAMREQLGRSALRRFNTWPSLDEVSDAMATWFHAVAGGEPIQKDGSG